MPTERSAKENELRRGGARSPFSLRRFSQGDEKWPGMLKKASRIRSPAPRVVKEGSFHRFVAFGEKGSRA
jgi:hypothetical protein